MKEAKAKQQEKHGTANVAGFKEKKNCRATSTVFFKTTVLIVFCHHVLTNMVQIMKGNYICMAEIQGKSTLL